MFKNNDIKLAPCVFICLIALISCDSSSSEDSIMINKDSIMVNIVHNTSEQYSLNSQFVVTDSTHILVRIADTRIADAPSILLWEKDFQNIEQLPFRFIFSKANDLFDEPENPAYYSISAEVLAGPGTNAYVGDLTSEYYTPIYAGQKTVTLEVQGLEDCNSPIAGGLCTTNYR